MEVTLKRFFNALSCANFNAFIGCSIFSCRLKPYSSISHDGEWGIGKSKLSAYYNDYDSSISDSKTKSNELIIEGSLSMPFQAVFEQELTVGGQWKKQELTNSDTIGTLPGGSWDGQSYTNPKVDNKSWAFFLENNINLLDNL